MNSILRMFTWEIYSSCPQGRSTLHSDLFRSAREYMHTCAFLKKNLHNTMHISIRDFIFKHLSAKNVTKETSFNKIRDIWGSILEALMKNLHLFRELCHENHRFCTIDICKVSEFILKNILTFEAISTLKILIL